LVRLVETMVEIARECRRTGQPLAFPTRIVPDDHGGHHLPGGRVDLRALYPDYAAFDGMDRGALQAEISHLRWREQEQAQELAALKRRGAPRSAKAWLGRAGRTVVPPRLRWVFGELGRSEAWSELPSWATPARARGARSPGAGEG